MKGPDGKWVSFCFLVGSGDVELKDIETTWQPKERPEMWDRGWKVDVKTVHALSS
jgi:hypothetical protein